MNKDKLKLIVRNLELLVDSLKAEVYSDKESYLQDNPKVSYLPQEYDEMYDDDDGYPDWWEEQKN